MTEEAFFESNLEVTKLTRKALIILFNYSCFIYLLLLINRAKKGRVELNRREIW